MADQHGVGLVGVERAVGFVAQVVSAHRGAASQGQRSFKMHAQRCGDEGQKITCIKTKTRPR